MLKLIIEKRGTSALEYTVIVTAVMSVIGVFSGHSGVFTKTYNSILGSVANQMVEAGSGRFTGGSPLEVAEAPGIDAVLGPVAGAGLPLGGVGAAVGGVGSGAGEEKSGSGEAAAVPEAASSPEKGTTALEEPVDEAAKGVPAEEESVPEGVLSEEVVLDDGTLESGIEEILPEEVVLDGGEDFSGEDPGLSSIAAAGGELIDMPATGDEFVDEELPVDEGSEPSAPGASVTGAAGKPEPPDFPSFPPEDESTGSISPSGGSTTGSAFPVFVKTPSVTLEQLADIKKLARIIAGLKAEGYTEIPPGSEAEEIIDRLKEAGLITSTD